MSEYKFSPLAEDDLRDIWRDIAAGNEAAADGDADISAGRVTTYNSAQELEATLEVDSQTKIET